MASWGSIESPEILPTHSDLAVESFLEMLKLLEVGIVVNSLWCPWSVGA